LGPAEAASEIAGMASTARRVARSGNILTSGGQSTLSEMAVARLHAPVVECGT
jgi:hypothetical protein